MSELKEQVMEKAALAVEQFQERSVSALDYSEASLTAIEDMLDEASDFIDELPEEQINALTNLAGSYVLAVAANEFEGQFYWHEQQDQPVFVVGEPEFNVAIITFNKVRGRLNGDTADNLPFFYKGFAERARQAKSGDSALYV
ncbi:MAG: hypothetical protein HWE27_17900 [Gammaproteobacteria bacterium]|nr:hypothetical protein [Gammaproteobacteria bacterium]